MENSNEYKENKMGTINKNQRQVTLYYSSETSLGKQTYGYVSASKREVLAIDISKTKVTGTQWADLAENLEIGISDLINKKHPDFTKTYGSEEVDLEDHDWMKVLHQHPEVLACPIAINGDDYLLIKNPSDFVHFMGNQNVDDRKDESI